MYVTIFFVSGRTLTVNLEEVYFTYPDNRILLDDMKNRKAVIQTRNIEYIRAAEKEEIASAKLHGW